MDYQKIYDRIINRAILDNRKKCDGIYYESHHIIPRCMGGTNKSSNLVLLTAKEHYMAHRLLCEIYPDNNKLRYALWMMINGSTKYKRYITSNGIYSKLKEEYSKSITGRIYSVDSRKKMSESAKNRRPMSDETKKKLSDIGKNKPAISDETKKKMSISAKNKESISEETRKRRSISLTGRIFSEETKKKMSESAKGKPKSEEYKIKMSNASKGRIFSDEHRKKISDAKKSKSILKELK
jgi:hypothetical protein